MNQLSFIVAAYALFAAATLWLGIDAATRTARARRRLRAVDPRAERLEAEA